MSERGMECQFCGAGRVTAQCLIVTPKVIICGACLTLAVTALGSVPVAQATREQIRDAVLGKSEAQ